MYKRPAIGTLNTGPTGGLTMLITNTVHLGQPCIGWLPLKSDTALDLESLMISLTFLQHGIIHAAQISVHTHDMFKYCWRVRKSRKCSSILEPSSRFRSLLVNEAAWKHVYVIMSCTSCSSRGSEGGGAPTVKQTEAKQRSRKEPRRSRQEQL